MTKNEVTYQVPFIITFDITSNIGYNYQLPMLIGGARSDTILAI